ncbi:MAG: hypothetical protein IKC72_04100 [Clostridia bacterium]|nr:hypothetical protein [Clostridia bacterium]
MKKLLLLFLVLMLSCLLSLTACTLYFPEVPTPEDSETSGENEKGENEKTPENDSNHDNSSEEDNKDNNETPPEEEDEPITSSDPYINVNKDEFYANYTPAKDYMDAYYRSEHGLMSGDIVTPDQAPNVASYRPMRDGKYIRNTAVKYEDDGNTFILTDAYGNKVKEIYKDGAYITLDEVAAYVYAFGDIPRNYTSSKKTSALSGSIWGEYLRLNNTQFSGSTTKYPYEPELPRISGCGGDLIYYEIDIGTTGTDCDPGYRPTIYNSGTRITRGAARLVYARSADDITERYVFYTYNHYNDFQEYLGYAGGFGTMFGNITGGGTLSSKTDCNPTPYIPTAMGTLPKDTTYQFSTTPPFCVLGAKEDAPFVTFEDFLNREKHKIPSKYKLDPEAVAQYKEQKLREKTQEDYEEYLLILKREEFRKVFISKYKLKIDTEKTEEQLQKEYLLNLQNAILTKRRQMIDQKISNLVGGNAGERIATMNFNELANLLDLLTQRITLTKFPARAPLRSPFD